MQQVPLFTECTTVLAYIGPEATQGEVAGWQGDYEFSYVELVERLDATEHEQYYRVRLAPVHIHIGTRMRILSLTPEQRQSMVHVKYEPHENFLAPHSVIFPHAPASMDVVYIEPLWQPLDGYIESGWHPSDEPLVARVAPVTLYINGEFSDAIIREDWSSWGYSISGLPLQRKPQAMHTCRQRKLLGVLASFDNQYRL